ncbi:hypothetical protein CGRA01v4_05276 [Colletotrichum graminicola]|nr:hypothetical protein CGRA01v4_05276 [Colletotrichum graminicola]
MTSPHSESHRPMFPIIWSTTPLNRTVGEVQEDEHDDNANAPIRSIPPSGLAGRCRAKISSHQTRTPRLFSRSRETQCAIGQPRLL